MECAASWCAFGRMQTTGKPMPVEDSYIAGIARRHNLTIATGNVKDFRGPEPRFLISAGINWSKSSAHGPKCNKSIELEARQLLSPLGVAKE